MKKIFPLLTAALLIITAACSSFSNRGTIDRPFIDAAITDNFSIEKIELSDSSTILHAVVHFRPGWWIQFSDSSYIFAKGEKYLATSVDGIPTGKHVNMPDSGVLRFSINFPAIPADARTIDFHETEDSDWKLWGIDLTGTADNDIHLSQIPSDLRKPYSGEEVKPNPVIKSDTTTVNIHLLGYRPGLAENMIYIYDSAHGQVQPDDKLVFDEEGNSQVKLPLAAPAQIYIINGSTSAGMANLAPGETVDLYVDMHNTGIANMNVRDNVETGHTALRPVISSGQYAEMDKYSRLPYSMNPYSGEFGNYKMTGEEYTLYSIGMYRNLLDSINADASLTPLEKQTNRSFLQSDLYAVATEPRRTLERNYRNVYQDWRNPIPSDSVTVALSADNMKAFAELIDFNDPMWYFNGKLGMTANPKPWAEHGIDAGLIKDSHRYAQLYKAANSGKVTKAQLKELSKINPAFAEDVAAHNQASLDLLSSLDRSSLKETPAVADDKVFDAIVAPHKGKVVMVDLWNTWCRPCRMALAENEPAKATELASDDIVWIYIADESSDEVQYLKMIQDIKGIHYKVNKTQINAIRNRFDVDGIPYYILVDRNGKATGRPDLRDHSQYKKTLLKEVAKK